MVGGDRSNEHKVDMELVETREIWVSGTGKSTELSIEDEAYVKGIYT